MLDQNLKDDILHIINKIETTPYGSELLTDIFEFHIKSDKTDIVQSIQMHLNEAFQMNFLGLFRYFQIQEIISDSDLNLSESNTLLLINNLKRKYGFIIRELQIKNENPFLLKGMGISFNEKESLFNASLIRNDGDRFDTMVNAQALLNIVNVSCIHLDNVLKSGIYNLDINSVETFLNSGGNLLTKFNKLLGK